MTSTERQRAYRERMLAEGYVQVTGWVHSHQAGYVAVQLARLKRDPDLTPGPMRNTKTNRFESIEQ